METLKITVVGKDIFDLVEDKCSLVGLNTVNTVKRGMLGNLTTLTLEFDIPEDKVIQVRRHLMDKLSEDSFRLVPMYVHRDWMRIFVFKPMRL